MRSVALILGVGFAALSAHTTSAQQPALHAGGERLGEVHFATSCAPAVAPDFNRAVALLHSFEFGASIRAFNGVLHRDSTCAMAQWGIALSSWTNPMAPTNRPPTALKAGRIASDAAVRLAASASERERGYAGAVSELYADAEHRDQRTRVLAYEHAMSELAAQNPADTEAQIFHALSHVAAAAPTDKTYANQLKAGAILEAIWARQPDHPGLAHYIIHSYDVPALAPRAALAARRYATIAPSAAHALHMPSHTFTRVGAWQQSIATNTRSVAAARQEGSIAEALHASDYMEYAYLQLGRTVDAKAVVDGLPALAANFDPTVVAGAAPGSAGVYALAAIPARYALERRKWTEAARLVPHPSSFPYADAVTYFARALGAAHTGDLVSAQAAADSLAACRGRLVVQNESYWTEQVAIQELIARAWIALADHHADDALARMREAVVREDATEKSAVTPGPIAPARELLGDMLIEVGRPADAVAEYKRTLEKEPGRLRSIEGSKQAAKGATKNAKAG
ncbi:MAG: hypothetical protein ABJE47_20490 [bacterium]